MPYFPGAPYHVSNVSGASTAPSFPPVITNEFIIN